VPRRTRIVATLGPATDRPGVLEKLLEIGLDVARINFSHGSADEHRQRIARLRALSDARGRPVAVLADLPGPKLRALVPQPLELAVGQQVTLARDPQVSADIHLTEPEVLARVQPGQRVLLDDGRLQGKISGVGAERVTVTITDGGTLSPKKGINLPETELDIPALTRRDHEAVRVACEAGADWLALSFVRDASAAEELRRSVGACTSALRPDARQLPILAKIERPEAVRKAAEIIDAFDGIMVARGDLGVEIALEKVPHVQKQLIRMARAAAKPVITATDMLDSMRHNPRPTRAEVSDVANAVYDGTDAVMLSGETAIGDHPIEAITCMHNTLCEAEAHQTEDAPRPVDAARGKLIDQVAHMTRTFAEDAHAAAIVVPTITGRTARYIARHRPAPDIIAVTSAPVVRQLSVLWGVRAVVQSAELHPGDDRLAAAVRAAFAGGAVQAGALIVVLARHPIEGGEGLPTIRLGRVGSDGATVEA
jgi:pyruvate kinase